MLCYVVLCYVMSCYAMLCYVMSCYVMCLKTRKETLGTRLSDTHITRIERPQAGKTAAILGFYYVDTFLKKCSQFCNHEQTTRNAK